MHTVALPVFALLAKAVLSNRPPNAISSEADAPINHTMFSYGPTTSSALSTVLLTVTKTFTTTLTITVTASDGTSTSPTTESITSTVSTPFLTSIPSTKCSGTEVTTCSSTASPPAPTQGGTVAGCIQWYIAEPGDYCYTVAQKFNIPTDIFMMWNPSVGPPTCAHLLAYNAYCVSICDKSTSFSATWTITTASTADRTSPANTPTHSGKPYKVFKGNGSIKAGWPAIANWLSFDAMFKANTPQMLTSCAQWGVPNDTHNELAIVKQEILIISKRTKVDARFILAVILQESTGCVRVITTRYSWANPGLMQSHNGTGSCNTNEAYATGDEGVQTPCPRAEIRQMIKDGTAGTKYGDGLKQLLATQARDATLRAVDYYRAARLYNGGAIDASGNLAKGCCTACYCSDIANRLVGWTTGERKCDLTL